MFGICNAFMQEINGFYIEIGPLNTPTKANGPYFEFVHELTN